MGEVREIRAVAVGAVVVGTYMALVLLSGRVDPLQFAQLLSVYVGGSLTLWTILGVITLLARLVRGARASGNAPFMRDCMVGFVRERWERDRFASLLWPPLLFPALLASFNAYKQMVLPTAGFGLDPFLRQADKLLFLGNDPWTATHALLGSPGATVIVDRFYHGWFAPMAVGLLICAWLPASSYRLRTQYVFSYIAVWVGIGSVLAFLLPSSGPCFYAHFHGADPSFSELMRRLAQVQADSGEHLNALSNQHVLLAAFGGDRLAIGRGISAMPSVHNGLAVLFALAAFRVSKVAGLLFSAYALLIWIGSIHLGWHYALDGIVAVGLTIVFWGVAGRVADRLERPLVDEAIQPAVA